MKKLLREGLSARLWRISSVRAAWMLFKRNELVASVATSNLGDLRWNKGKIYFVSFARSRTSRFFKIFNAYAATIVVEYDGRAIGNRYKGGALDYYGGDGADEMEDRIFTNKPSIRGILKWVNEVSVIGSKIDDKDRRMIRDIIKVCRDKGIPVKFYENLRMRVRTIGIERQ